MTASIQQAQDRERLQAALDHEVKGAFSSAIGLARLALRDGNTENAMKALDFANEKSQELSDEAMERYGLLDPTKVRQEFYAIRLNGDRNLFLVAARNVSEAVKHAVGYTRPLKVEVESMIDGNDPDLNERMGKVES